MKYIIMTFLAFALIAPNILLAQSVDVKDLQVKVEEENGYKKITIKKTMEDGTITIINWEGKGEIPEDITKELGPGGSVIFKEEEKDSSKVLTKQVTVIVEKDGNQQSQSTEKQIKVIVQKEGEELIQLGNEAEVIILKEGDEMEEKEVKVWMEKTEELSEEEMELRVRTKQGKGERDAVEKVLIIKRGKEKEENNQPMEAPKIERSLKLKRFQVSPNPASEQITLQFEGKKAPLTVRLLDASGREVYKEFRRDFDGNYQNQITLNWIPTDFFFVSIEQKGEYYTEKVLHK